VLRNGPRGIVGRTAPRPSAEAALGESEERARSIFKGFPLPTFAWRRVGDDFVLTDYNDAGLALTRGRAGSLMGRSARELYPDMPEVLEDLARCFEGRASITREMVFRFRTTGEVRPIRTTYGFVPPDTVIVHVEDITARILAEEESRTHTRQQAVVAELSQLALGGVELDRLMDQTVDGVARTLEVEYCQVLELLPGGTTLHLRAGAGWRQGYVRRATVSAAPSLLPGYTIASKQPVVVEDLGAEVRFAEAAHVQEHGVVSGLCVGIAGDNRTFGVLSAHSTRKRSYSVDDVHFLEAMANVLASAILRKRGETFRGRLLHRLISAQDDERRRLARELHDEAGQSLTSLLVGLRTVREARTLKDARAAAERLRPIAAQTLEELSRLSRGLHPSVLDDLGLVTAVTRLGRDHGRRSGATVQLTAEGLGPERLPAAVETTLYRIAQEALTNIAKHACARRVSIGIKREGDAITLTVEDDGTGFDVAGGLEPGAASHLGLLGMRERAALHGGAVTIASVSGQGTLVSIALPLTPR
jgi:signal transduction histidine kinase